MGGPRPLPWLGHGPHSVDLLTSLGHQAVSAGLGHLACNWGTQPFDSGVFNSLSPHRYLWTCPIEATEPPYVPMTVSSLICVPLMEPTSRPVPFMTRADLVAWWQQSLRAVQDGDICFSSLLAEPVSIIRSSLYHLHYSFELVSDDNAALGTCLSMIGAGALGILCASSCQLCQFRLALPPTSRCGSCSRSKHVVDPADDRHAAARAWRARLIRAGASGIKALADDDIRSSFARAIASIGWSMRTGGVAHRQWLTSVQQALQAAPLVQALLPHGFAELQFREQMIALQTATNDADWDHAVWARKISAAQAWMASSEAVKSRRRVAGPLPATLALATAARELLRKGLLKAQVAQSLGISPSHLSHMLRRTSTNFGN